MIPNFLSTFRRPESKVSKEASSSSTQASMFNSAKNTQINGGYFVNNIVYKTVSRTILCLFFCLLSGVLYLALSHLQGVHEEQREAMSSLIEPVTSRARESPDKIYTKVAMNAVLNDGGRAEDAKCHPGTREEVIGIIEQWIDSRDNPNRILWLSGPAGGGKTAIMKTVAERSEKRGVDTVNFFFFRGDPTRNSAHPFAATLLHQILLLYPAARHTVDTILSINGPPILDSSIQNQFIKFIYPLFDIIRESSPQRTPTVLLVDGLDECDVDAMRSQDQILRALDNLVTQKNSPFVALVASRPEPYIGMVFKQLTSKSLPIFLDDQYLPEKDIELFVTAEFDRIKASHSKADGVPDGWPSESAVKAIVAKSSGQFIYAATVMRFLEYSPAVPSVSLDRVQGIVPPGRNSPFTHLDSVYSYILTQTDNADATQDILSSKLFDDLTGNWVCVGGGDDKYCDGHQHLPDLKKFLNIYNSNYTDAMVDSYLSELAAIVQLRYGHLIFYHASLEDFLRDSSRSGIFYIDLKEFSKKIFPAMWRSSITHSYMTLVPYIVPLGVRLINDIQQTTPAITEALLTVQTPQCNDRECELLYSTRYYDFLSGIPRLYYPHDIKSYKKILRKWTTEAEGLHYTRHQLAKVPLLRSYLFLAKAEKWFSIRKWNTLAAGIHVLDPPNSVAFLETWLFSLANMAERLPEISEHIADILTDWGSYDKKEELNAWADIWLSILTMAVMTTTWIVVRNGKEGDNAPLRDHGTTTAHGT